MGFEVVDGYLLGEAISKPDVVTALLRERSDAPSAAPFYRALEAVGARAADEAFIALRLVLAGKPADDDRVARLRAFAGVARAAKTGDTAGLERLRRRESHVLEAILGGADLTDGSEIRARAEAAYHRELQS